MLICVLSLRTGSFCGTLSWIYGCSWGPVFAFAVLLPFLFSRLLCSFILEAGTIGELSGDPAICEWPWSKETLWCGADTLCLFDCMLHCSLFSSPLPDVMEASLLLHNILDIRGCQMDIHSAVNCNSGLCSGLRGSWYRPQVKKAMAALALQILRFLSNVKFF